MYRNLYTKGLILIAAVTLIIACSPKTSYKTLSVFFDGVPNPEAIDSIALADSTKQAERSAIQNIGPAKPQIVFHPPYLEKDCAMCHDQNSIGHLTEPMPGLCYQCHEDFADQYKVLHGPVGGGFCTQCHSPHMSKNKHLLIRTGQQLCLYCHNPEDVFKNEAHSDIEETNCTECHNPHGGDDRFIFN